MRPVVRFHTIQARPNRVVCSRCRARMHHRLFVSHTCHDDIAISGPYRVANMDLGAAIKACGATCAEEFGLRVGVKGARSLHNTVAAWRERGVPPGRADEIAARLNMHPALIWGDAFYAGCDTDPATITALLDIA